ncbi:hypothetical protein [Pseudomonas sp. S1(2024)]|uniref:hypothetical protein n=1 Tax=Pseudomonas sp. S1(2024) TaxID=3390191 RepID=UPI00397AE21F
MNSDFNIRNQQAYPFSDAFTAISSGNKTQLSYRLGDLDLNEVRLTHNDNTVILNIQPYSHAHLIGNMELFLSGIKAEFHADIFKKFADLRWKDCSSSELDALAETWQKHMGGGHEAWIAQALAMARPFHFSLVELRDKWMFVLDEENYANSMSLDSFVSLSQNKVMSETARKQLSDYLMTLPGYDQADMLKGSISPKAYEMHAFHTMRISSMLMGAGHRNNKQRTYRLGNAIIKYTAALPIRDITAVLTDDILSIELVHAESDFKAVHIQQEQCKN